MALPAKSSRRLVAIAGGTCAGKSTLAAALLERLPGHLNVIPEDSFYPDRSSLTEHELELVRWDSVESIDSALFSGCVQRQLVGNGCGIPDYNRVSHARSGHLHFMTPKPTLVVEGLHVISLMSYLRSEGRLYLARDSSLKVFIDCPEKVRFERRLERERRSKTIAGDFDLYWRMVCEPIFMAEIHPQREEANLILKCSFSGNEVEQITEWILRA